MADACTECGTDPKVCTHLVTSKGMAGCCGACGTGSTHGVAAGPQATPGQVPTTDEQHAVLRSWGWSRTLSGHAWMPPREPDTEPLCSKSFAYHPENHVDPHEAEGWGVCRGCGEVVNTGGAQIPEHYVRVVAVPTDHEDQPADAERADPDRDRPDTTVTPQAQPHLFAGSDDSPDDPR